jgi:hypothetical protein
METVRIRDPGWKKVGSGIRDKHPGFATLAETVPKFPTKASIHIHITYGMLYARYGSHSY